MKAERMLFELDECKFRAAPSSAAEDKTALLIGLTKREMKIRSQKYERAGRSFLSGGLSWPKILCMTIESNTDSGNVPIYLAWSERASMIPLNELVDVRKRNTLLHRGAQQDRDMWLDYLVRGNDRTWHKQVPLFPDFCMDATNLKTWAAAMHEIAPFCESHGRQVGDKPRLAVSAARAGEVRERLQTYHERAVHVQFERGKRRTVAQALTLKVLGGGDDVHGRKSPEGKRRTRS